MASMGRGARRSVGKVMAVTERRLDRKPVLLTMPDSVLARLLRRARRIQGWFGTPGGRVWADALWVWALSRAIFLVLSAFIPALLPDSSHRLTILDRWATQDAYHFIQIAQRGYDPLWRTAYWPLFPLLMRALTPVAGGSEALAGMLIANIAFLGALAALRSLAERESGVDAARRACLYLALFPTAFYFFAPYAEPLFLLFAILSFASMRARRWWLAGIFGFLATLTKSAGMLLLVPFAIELLSAWHVRAARWWDAVWLACIPSAAGIFSTYLYVNYADPLAYAHSQAYWGRTVRPPWVTIAESVMALLGRGTTGISGAHLALNLAAVLIFLGISGLALGRLPLSYGLYALSVCAYFLTFSIGKSTLGLEGDGRYVLMIFPAFILLGQLARHRWVHETLLVMMSVLLTVLTAHFLLQLASG